MDTQDYGTRIRQALGSQAGFTLAELLAAVFIIGLAQLPQFE